MYHSNPFVVHRNWVQRRLPSNARVCERSLRNTLHRYTNAYIIDLDSVC